MHVNLHWLDVPERVKFKACSSCRWCITAFITRLPGTWWTTAFQLWCGQSTTSTDVKNVLYVFYSCHVFNVLKVFLYLTTFLKTFSEKFHQEVREALLKPKKRISLICLHCIMIVAVRRAALYPLRIEHITLGSAYSDTATVTSCSRESQYVKS